MQGKVILVNKDKGELDWGSKVDFEEGGKKIYPVV